MPNKIRVIEYEILKWEEFALMETIAEAVRETLGEGSDVGILRCTAPEAAKITFVGTASATRDLIASGRASWPDGLMIPKADFPVMLVGWSYRFRAP
jgi:hypothetical protein